MRGIRNIQVEVTLKRISNLINFRWISVILDFTKIV